MKPIFCITLLLALFGTSCSKPKSPVQLPTQPPKDSTVNNPPPQQVVTDVQFWLTNPDKSALFQRQNVSLLFSANSNGNPTIVVDTTQHYQSIDGFGFCLTGGSAYLLYRLPANQRQALLQELFSTDSTGIGISYLRLSMGASDLSQNVFSYDDIPAGQTDTTLQYFSLGADTYSLVPLLQEILQINPDIQIIATPWS
ncbi:MAG: glucosylceramidase, partial [Chitinophagaceae bacterium]